MTEISELVWAPPAFVLHAEDGSLQTPDDGFQFQLPLSQTWPLLDMQDCISDLDSVITIGQLLETRMAEGDFDFDLFNALVISYGRGFQSGRSRVPGEQRANLRPFVDRLSPENVQQHEAVMRIRNRRVAHSVDTGAAMVTASFARDGSFVDLGAVHVGMGVRSDEVRRTVILAEQLRQLAYEETDRLRTELRRDWEGRTLTSQQMDLADRHLSAYLQSIREQQ